MCPLATVKHVSKRRKRDEKCRDSRGSTKRARTSVSRCSRARPALIEKASSLRSLFSSPSSCSRERNDVTAASSGCSPHTLFARAYASFSSVPPWLHLSRGLLRRHIFFYDRNEVCGSRMFSEKGKMLTDEKYMSRSELDDLCWIKN